LKKRRCKPPGRPRSNVGSLALIGPSCSVSPAYTTPAVFPARRLRPTRCAALHRLYQSPGETIDKSQRRVYVHPTPNADGSNPESGRPADADEAGAQAPDLSAFCCARRRKTLLSPVPRAGGVRGLKRPTESCDPDRRLCSRRWPRRVALGWAGTTRRAWRYPSCCCCSPRHDHCARIGDAAMVVGSWSIARLSGFSFWTEAGVRSVCRVG
jgi:hypothetical protein